jgi:hypothetical protein
MSLLFPQEAPVFNPFQTVVRLRSLHSPYGESPKQPQDVSTNTPPCSREELSHRIMLEQLRQARCSFNLSLIVIATGTIIGFTGAGLLLMGKTTEGAAVTTGSLLHWLSPAIGQRRKRSPRQDDRRFEGAEIVRNPSFTLNPPPCTRQLNDVTVTLQIRRQRLALFFHFK